MNNSNIYLHIDKFVKSISYLRPATDVQLWIVSKVIITILTYYYLQLLYLYMPF